jgi:hypothetical protein
MILLRAFFSRLIVLLTIICINIGKNIVYCANLA